VLPVFPVLLLQRSAASRSRCRLSTDKSIVLKHHPDKRKAAGERIVEGDNDYFTCITKGNARRHG